MLYGKYTFCCRLEDDANLPPFKGSTVRGVFGRALKKVVCALKLKDCNDCLLQKECLYSIVFETPTAAFSTRSVPKSSPPHPFVIEPPLMSDTTLKKGDLLNFHLLLFGEINKKLPYFIYAFNEMGEIGIGKKNNGRRSRFFLEKVTSNNQTVYSMSESTLHMPEEFFILELKKGRELPTIKSGIVIHLKTPLRLKFKNRLTAELPFHIFVRSMLRRISSLYECYGNGEPQIDYRSLVQKAQDIQSRNVNLTWFDWKRYSSRQGIGMQMGGIVGSVRYQGNLAEFLPFIDMCEILHVGKQTSFGLGQYKTELLQ